MRSEMQTWEKRVSSFQSALNPVLSLYLFCDGGRPRRSSRNDSTREEGHQTSSRTSTLLAHVEIGNSVSTKDVLGSDEGRPSPTADRRCSLREYRFIRIGRDPSCKIGIACRNAVSSSVPFQSTQKSTTCIVGSHLLLQLPELCTSGDACMCAFTSVPFHPHFRVALSEALHLRRHIDVDSFVCGDQRSDGAPAALLSHTDPMPR